VPHKEETEIKIIVNKHIFRRDENRLPNTFPSEKSGNKVTGKPKKS
jgi:hypothetical protein